MNYFSLIVFLFRLHRISTTARSRAVHRVAETPITLYPKVWVDKLGQEHSNPVLEDSNIKVISWNILGPYHAETAKHNYAETKVVLWNKRREKILSEIRGMNADIICLQEVSSKSLKETFIPGLRHLGLECCGYAPMQITGRGRGKYAHKGLGCAVFARSSKVTVLTSKKVYLRDFFPHDTCRSHSFLSDLEKRWNSMVMMLVRIDSTNQTLLVGNTHLYWNPSRADIKTAQGLSVVNALSKFTDALKANKTICELCNLFRDDIEINSDDKGNFRMKADDNFVQIETWSPTSESLLSVPPQSLALTNTKGATLPLILCGDFNTMPEYSRDGLNCIPSGLFHLLTRGELPSDHPEHPDSWHTSMTFKDANPRIGRMSSRWRLRNAYVEPKFENRRPLFTTKTDDFQGWIDHVFVNEKVDVEMVWSPPIYAGDLEANTKARSFGPIPDSQFPSDHLPIGIVARISSIS